MIASKSAPVTASHHAPSIDKHRIDIRLCLHYSVNMKTKTRPIECCVTPVEPPAISLREQDRIVAAFKALGDPTRLDIYRLIAAQESPLCVCDIVTRFEVSQPTISHHLKVLREAGLVSVSRRGVWAYYAAEPHSIETLRKSLDLVAPRVVVGA